MRTDGTNLRQLSHASGWGRFSQKPNWSPDGRQIVFTKEGGKLPVMNASGTGLRQVTKSGSVEHSPTWSPDGRKVAFVRGQGNKSEIYVMNADGTGVTRLTRDKVVEGSPA